MSTSYDTSTPFIGAEAQTQQELIEELGLSTRSYLPTPQDLSPNDQSHTFSNSASPSFNFTPGDSAYDFSGTDLDDYENQDDPYAGVNFSVEPDQVDLAAVENTQLDVDAFHFQQLSFGGKPLDANLSGAVVVNNAAYPLTLHPHTKGTTLSSNSDLNEHRNQVATSHEELTTKFPEFATSNAPQRPTAQLTPEHSGNSSDTSAEDVSPGKMDHPHTSPRLTISHYDDGPHQPSERKYEDVDASYFPSHGVLSGTSAAARDPILRDDDGSWQRGDRSGTSGIGPEDRRDMAGAEVPSTNDQEKQRLLEERLQQVRAWNAESGAEGHADPDEPTAQPQDQEAENNVDAVSETESIRDNKIVEGQAYYNPEASTISFADHEIFFQSRHWDDAPMYLKTTTNRTQPESSTAAMMRYLNNADNLSVISRRATWGTRRRLSEPSMTERDLFAEGGLFGRLSISKEKEEKPSRQHSIIDQSRTRLNKLGNLVRSRSHKRSISSTRESFEDVQPATTIKSGGQSSLAPPPSRSTSVNRRSTPSINTALAAVGGTVAAVGATHARNGSVSATVPSPKSPAPLAQARLFLARHRSKSEVPGFTSPHDQGIVGLLRTQGGPPVPSLPTSSVQPQPEPQPQYDEGVADVPEQDDDEDEEDDELLEGGEVRPKLEESTEPIIPNMEGFKAHISRLNPGMEHQFRWLISRTAHQQEFRYKLLLTAKVDHEKAVRDGSCTSRENCEGLGGHPTLQDAKGHPRRPESVAQAEYSEEDSGLAEGTITEDSFPKGVPMPPVRSLPAKFECPLCFKVKKFQKPSDWTKHVHEDVQPFTCTFDKCKESKSFKRKADWVRHENEIHRHLEWWTCQIEECRHQCFRKDNFLQHLVREHKMPEPKDKSKAAVKRTRTTEPALMMLERCHHDTTKVPQQEPCKFCGRTFTQWKKLTVHLAKHMEDISLPILRVVEKRDVDASTIISPVKEKESEPVTPIGRTKVESHSPANLDHIPSHPQVTSPFPTYQHGFFPDQSNFEIQPQTPQGMMYHNNPMYGATYGMPVSQPRPHGGSLDSGLQQLHHSRGFDSLDPTLYPSGVPQAEFDQLPTHNFTMAAQNNSMSQNSNLVSQNFTSASPMSGFGNVLGINTHGSPYDTMSAGSMQDPQYHSARMMHSSMSPSPYGQPPHDPYFQGQ